MYRLLSRNPPKKPCSKFTFLDIFHPRMAAFEVGVDMAMDTSKLDTAFIERLHTHMAHDDQFKAAADVTRKVCVHKTIDNDLGECFQLYVHRYVFTHPYHHSHPPLTCLTMVAIVCVRSATRRIVLWSRHVVTLTLTLTQTPTLTLMQTLTLTLPLLQGPRLPPRARPGHHLGHVYDGKN